MRKRTTRRCFSEISEGEDSQGPGLQEVQEGAPGEPASKRRTADTQQDFAISNTLLRSVTFQIRNFLVTGFSSSSNFPPARHFPCL